MGDVGKVIDYVKDYQNIRIQLDKNGEELIVSIFDIRPYGEVIENYFGNKYVFQINNQVSRLLVIFRN